MEELKQIKKLILEYNKKNQQKITNIFCWLEEDGTIRVQLDNSTWMRIRV